MKILSVHDGHNATICYMENGEINHLLSEERFTNDKNQGGFPKNAFEYLQKQLKN